MVDEAAGTAVQVSALADVLLKGRRERDRITAADALGEIGGDEAVAALVTYFSDTYSGALNEAAAAALAKCGEPGLKALIDLLHDVKTRSLAVQVLRRLDDPLAVEALADVERQREGYLPTTVASYMFGGYDTLSEGQEAAVQEGTAPDGPPWKGAGAGAPEFAIQSQGSSGVWAGVSLPSATGRAGTHRHRRTAWWLFAIAAFTVFNAVEWLEHQSLRMVIGLISTRQLTFLIYDQPRGGTILLAAAIAAALVFAILGLLVYEGHTWALLVAIGIYGADLVLFLVRIQLRDPMGLFFHALALGVMVSGYRAIRQLEAQRARSAL